MSALRTAVQRMGALLLTLTVLAVLGWLTVGSYLNGLTRARDANVQVAQQIARLRASLERRVAVDAPSAEERALLLAEPSAGGGGETGTDLAAADLQARLRDLVQAYGGQVEQLTTTPADEEAPFVTVQVQLTTEEQDAFAFLAALDMERPALAVEQLEMTALQDRTVTTPTRRLRFTLTVTAARPGGAAP